MKRYHVWTIGCQMNVADSHRVGAALERLGYKYTSELRKADVIVLNTCVVRQSAEDRAIGRIWSLKPLKSRENAPVIALMGCMVGEGERRTLRRREALLSTFPHLDVLMPPGDPAPLVQYLRAREAGGFVPEEEEESRLHAGPTIHLAETMEVPVCACLPVLYGCNHTCSYCVIPSRRGKERSREPGEIARETREMARKGVREVTLLGQIVDRYGCDLEGDYRLQHLLRDLSEVEELARIRFLTSHPTYMTDGILEAVASLPKVCPHIEVPIQSGSDEVLRRMRRGYTSEDYRRLVEKIRRILPGCSIATDVIVGFPGETEAHFEETFGLLRELRMDVAHVAMYSPRPGTFSAASMEDDVPAPEKKRRLRAVNDLQERISGDINAALVGHTVEVLVEGRQKGKWKGRTPTNKLVFFEDTGDRRGRPARVRIAYAGAWSMQAVLSDDEVEEKEGEKAAGETVGEVRVTWANS